jgi:hypothetical protein
MMTTRQRAVRSQLDFSQRLLLLVPACHLALLLPEARVEPGLQWKFVWVGSSLFCIAGFLLANPHLGLAGRVSRFLTPTGGASLLMVGWVGFQAKYGLLLTIAMAFVVPVLNAVLALAVMLAIRSSISTREAEARRIAEADEWRREKFGPITENKR